MPHFDLPAIQSALAQFDLDAWLLADFRGSNPLAATVLGLDPAAHRTRRWLYVIPRQGTPKKLVHRIEPAALAGLPGDERIYLTWQDFQAGVAWTLVDLPSDLGQPRVALEYSPRNMIPYISRIDGGLLELVRDCGVEPVSSGNLLQEFEATWTPEQWQLHLQAAQGTNAAYDRVWRFLREAAASGHEPRETDVQDLIMNHFAEHGLITDHPPIVGVGPHAGDPHYAPMRGADSAIRAGDLVLVDLWAKVDHPRGVYSDLTRMGYMGQQVPEKYAAVFAIVAAARDAAIALVTTRFDTGQQLAGWEVDQAARQVIVDAGYGAAFVHRTGHNIGTSTHGNGANMDNLETRDERRVLRRTCFSVEPGIYLPEFGIRSEVNVYVDKDGQVHVTGGDLQRQIVPILA
ncbi:MAG: M24 family metallopeptidase [Pirellulales bacterium]|nr:M24 family metallopeptidase [Pirellulales bacterium]